MLGIPRSGSVPAAMIALLHDKPPADLDGFVDGHVLARGHTRKGSSGRRAAPATAASRSSTTAWTRGGRSRPRGAGWRASPRISRRPSCDLRPPGQHGARLFVESEPGQAASIARRSGKPVLDHRNEVPADPARLTSACPMQQARHLSRRLGKGLLRRARELARPRRS